MGAFCSKSDGDIVDSIPEGPNAKHGTVGVMFDRFDKERKGYISLKNLKDMMKDDKTHIKGRDADHIMNKYGTDGKMNLDEFKQWWNSTYTTMDETDIANMVEEVQGAEPPEPMETIAEAGSKTQHQFMTKVATSRS